MAKWKPGDPVVFVQGVHYAVDKDGHPDLSQPLRADKTDGFRAAKDGDPLHKVLLVASVRAGASVEAELSKTDWIDRGLEELLALELLPA